MKKADLLPVLNKEYDFFDDGIVSENRKHKVLITAIIPFCEINKNILELWKREANNCDWIFNNKTDYFLKGTLMVKPAKKLIFARTKTGHWFSFNDNFWDGLLDISGKIAKQSEN